MAGKKFRDPIYGYITIDEKLIDHVIDTAAFQRLRDIIQTSYAPLYSSAVHNRFVHSMGVYHLGRIAAQSLWVSLCKQSPNLPFDAQQCIEIFELACLLHDVGHAPFSHTGETFYLKEGDRSDLHNELVKLVSDEDLEAEIANNAYKAPPHELMSAIVALKNYSNIIPADKKSFFARCICGYKYVNGLDKQKSYMNCLIELLNSKIIDVDKLDYLLRDAYMTGFDTVRIDYMRLLESARLYINSNGFYEICYYKSAVSVIENVVYAHDAERKWIQNHPIVLYEAHIIEELMSSVIHDLLGRDYLTDEFLCERGVQVKGLGRVRLMGDSDVCYLMKNLTNNSLCKEYYERKLRKHPIWKTESEFQAIFDGGEKALNLIKEEFDNLKDYLRSLGLPFLINDEALRLCQEEIKELKREQAEAEGLRQKKIQIALATKEEHIRWMRIFEQFSKDQNIKFEFLIIYTDQFNSGFRKEEFGNIKIQFPDLKYPCKFGDVSNVLKSEKSKGEKFFFLYYTREAGIKEIDISNLVVQILKLANDMSVDREISGRFAGKRGLK